MYHCWIVDGQGDLVLRVETQAPPAPGVPARVCGTSLVSALPDGFFLHRLDAAARARKLRAEWGARVRGGLRDFSGALHDAPQSLRFLLHEYTQGIEDALASWEHDR